MTTLGRTDESPMLPAAPWTTAGATALRTCRYYTGGARCAKSRLFPTTDSHGSQGPEFCTPCCFELIMHPCVGGWFSGVFPG